MKSLDSGVTERGSGRSDERRSVRRLTARQVRERFGVVARTIDRWLASTALAFPKPIRINKRRYFIEQEILDWEDRHRDRKAANEAA